MNRFFGKAKPKAPPPSLTDCIGTVGTRPRITRLRDSDFPDPAHPRLPAPTPFHSWFRTPRPSPPHLHSCYPGHSWRHKPGTPKPSVSRPICTQPFLRPTAVFTCPFLLFLPQPAVGPHPSHFSPNLYPSFILHLSPTSGPSTWYPRSTYAYPVWSS